MAEKKPRETADVSLPFAALQLLAPPVRLVSAALWKALKRRDVTQYGVVEEFVTSACETVPGLLTVRHQGKLTLGLRGRLILELCRTQPDPEVIEPHLRRIRAPASPPSSSSAPAAVRKDVKIARTIESFHSFVRTLLTDPTERELFFKEEFPVDYGPKFDEELEKLLWEFLIRLDQLLPVPNLAQTVSWLSDAPPILEECARSATQPQLLNVLLQHQTCLGHLEPAASLPPNMGDSILDSLSLPPSGRAPSDQPTAAQASAVDQPGSGTQTSFITPVFGIISNKAIPIMISGGTRALRGDKPASSQDGTDKHCESSKFTVVKERQTPNGDAVKEGEEEKLEEERVTSKRSRGVKRKQPDERQSEFEEEEDVVRMTRSGKKRMGWGDRRTVESEEDGAETVGNEELRTAVLATCMTQMGVEALQLPENPSLCSIFLSCLSSQPRVLLEKLPVASACAHRTGGGGKSSYRQQQQQNQRKKSPVKAPRRSGTGDQPGKPDSDTSGLDDKENHPVRPSISGLPSQLRSNTETLALTPDSEDYVADSEDEATKNFKGRLFMKRYYKTRHGTFVPTLREYWKPGAAQRDVLSAGGKRR
ncbi:TERF1-interacting nuclear factor 2 isoform X1 [Scophthalmus maximus]|uniref:TERF1-interacting nuclear factor 2 isoform X1 n=1 Tax=Scophthalmus maximus TaxID=52904 RepID=UPI001FA8BF42|nr:TERF1-interacting nuclear factor 2 isoform X1 [Scophthalmus maximus]